MRKLTLVLLFISGFVTANPEPPTTANYDHLISSCDELKKIKANKDLSYLITNDIDCSDIDWKPVGRFIGELDGNGHTISNITHNVANRKHGTGLFQRIQNAKITNLTISNTSTQIPEQVYVIHSGFLTGSAYNSVVSNVTINDSSTKGRTTSAAAYLVGYSVDSEFSNIVVTNNNISTSASTDKLGAITGYAKNTRFANLTISNNTISYYAYPTKNRVNSGMVFGELYDSFVSEVQVDNNNYDASFATFQREASLFAGAIYGASSIYDVSIQGNAATNVATSLAGQLRSMREKVVINNFYHDSQLPLFDETANTENVLIK